ncbi:MAG: adenylosuccinate lyase, partial [Candidatus Krumholzibacteriia bacterium]
EEAYAWVQRCAMRVWDAGVDFRAALAADPDVTARLGDAGLAACFDPERHLRHVDAIFARTLEE